MPIWTFEFQGVGVLPTDVAQPVVTYINGANTPPKSLGAGLLAIGGYTTAVLRSWEFTLNRDMSVRADDNSAAGHAGFTPGGRDVKLSVVIEADALATYDPYALSEASTPVALALQVGTAQYDQFTINLPQAEISDVEEGDDGATAIWEIEYTGVVSAIGLNDDVDFLMD